MGILEDFSSADKDGIVWRKVKASNGSDFEIGNRLEDIIQAVEDLKQRGQDDAGKVQQVDIERQQLGEGGARDWVGVHWPLGDDTWTDASQAAKDIGISQWRLYFNGHPNVFSYTLDFKNTKGWSFDFKDACNVVYTCSTVLNGEHYIKFNSDCKPIAIVGVK